MLRVAPANISRAGKSDAARWRQPLALDDILSHWREHGNYRPLIAPGDLNLVQASAEVLDKRVKITIANPHPCMCAPHTFAGVGTRPAGGLAQLINQFEFQMRNIRMREEAV